MIVRNGLLTAAFGSAALIVAGCAGGSNALPMREQPFSAAPAPVLPADGGSGCQSSDGIDASPCRIRFDALHAGPVTVRIRTGDNNRQRVAERDDCAGSNIANVSRADGHHYVVTAGTATGTCTARFTRAGMQHDDGGSEGARVRIVNAI